MVFFFQVLDENFPDDPELDAVLSHIDTEGLPPPRGNNMHSHRGDNMRSHGDPIPSTSRGITTPSSTRPRANSPEKL